MPGAAVTARKAATRLVRVTVRCHNRGRIGASQYPFRSRKNAEHTKLGRYSIVGPAFKLCDRFKILGRRDEVEDPGRRIAAWGQAMRILQARRTNRRDACQPPPPASNHPLA